MSDEKDILNQGAELTDPVTATPTLPQFAGDAIDWHLRVAALEDSVVELNMRLIAAEERIKSLTHPNKWPVTRQPDTNV